ncbi:MAG: M55 family metallopeptidase [Vampirovibrionales bacterium]|nr:M55 family metallopeptidase [Vampirovibrionales bacterium]
MPKLYISADLEGICWVTSPLQCSRQPDETAYRKAVEQLGVELQTVINAAFEAGASEIVVNDSHCTMANLDLSHVGERVSLLSGKPKLCAMSAGLDESFDAAFYIGYHAKSGTENGILNHTFHSRIFNVSINGQSLGETGINAYYASLKYQVPVLLVSGDQALCAEARSLLPKIQTVQTKTSISSTAALSRPLKDVLMDYQTAVHHVFQRRESWKSALLKLKKPYQLEVTFLSSLDADCASMLAPLTRMDGRTLRFETDDFQVLYQTLQAAYALTGYINYMGNL